MEANHKKILKAISLELRRDPADGAVRFWIRSDAGSHASGVLRFEEAP